MGDTCDVGFEWRLIVFTQVILNYLYFFLFISDCFADIFCFWKMKVPTPQVIMLVHLECI